MCKLMHQIFDRIFKCILLSSAKAVIFLINGLYKTNYPLDSTITYNLTEHLNDQLEKTLSDGVLTVNGIHGHHMEAQAYDDNTIAFRVFDYGYNHAVSHRGNFPTLNFPKPCIIYLGNNKKMPDMQTITVNFGDRIIVPFDITVFKVLDYTIEELDQMNLVLLIPFLLLKFRKKIAKSKGYGFENKLQTFILHDILKTIKKNVDAGILTELDSIRLWEITYKLYEYLYSDYDAFKVKGGLNDMIDDNFTLEVDRLYREWALIVDQIQQEKNLTQQDLDRVQQNLNQSEQNLNRAQQERNLVQQDLNRVQKEKELVQQELYTLEKKSVKSIFKLTKDLVTTAAELNLPVPQVQKYLDELQIAY